MDEPPSSSSALNANVLVLNRHYCAVQVISVRRSLCLLCKGDAEVVHCENGTFATYDFASWIELSELRRELGEYSEHDDWVVSVNFHVQAPRIIRLLEFDRVPDEGVKFNRRNIFLRDEHRCQYCGRQFSSRHLSLDHVVPRSRGGRATWDNIVCACVKCNVRKGSRTPQEAGMKLRRMPARPRRNPVITHKLNSRKYECWRTFVR